MKTAAMRLSALGKLLAYLIYLAACIIAVDYAFYRVYFKRVCPVSEAAEEVPDDKDSTPNHFSKNKPAGVVRIGCFGDSFTHGNEVDAHSDYPSWLQSLLARNGFHDVEVINFGVEGIGFHRAFDIWKSAVNHYGLDYAIIGPSCFQTERDATFSRTIDANLNYALQFLHPRYIRTNLGIEEIPPAGNVQENHLPAYMRFIPPLRYLRYDLRAPAFLAAPVYILAPGRRLVNPFYYRRDIPAEMAEIYSLQLDEIASHTPQVIVFNIESRIVRLAAALKRENMACFTVVEPKTFPFKAVGSHMSPSGNRHLAQLLSASLTGASESRQALVEFSPLPPPSGSSGANIKTSPTPRLSDYQHVAVEVAGIPLGRFYGPQVKYADDPYCEGPSCRFTADVFKDAASLIGFAAEGESPLDRPFLALDFPLREGAPLIIRTYSRAHRIKEDMIGRVRLLGAGFPAGWVDVSTMGLSADKTNSSWMDLAREGTFDEIELSLDGKVILSGTRADKSGIVRMFPRSGSTLLFIKGDGRVRFDPDAAPSSGYAYLCLKEATKRTCAPIAIFRKREKTFPVAAVSRPLQRRPGASELPR